MDILTTSLMTKIRILKIVRMRTEGGGLFHTPMIDILPGRRNSIKVKMTFSSNILVEVK